jgi:hypothetical protein
MVWGKIMQYILSEEEYEALQSKQTEQLQLNNKKLQALCTKIANEMPVKWGWGGPDPKPWGCKLTDEDEWHCDKCPVSEICPSDDKDWSK